MKLLNQQNYLNQNKMIQELFNKIREKLFIPRILATALLLLSVMTPTAFAQYPVAEQSPTTIGAAGGEEEKRLQTKWFVRTELFFGRNKADGTEVTEEEFADFLNQTITPEFPDGLTVLSGAGQFRESSGKIIQEKTKILILLYPSNTRRSSSGKIERIRAAYKTRFAQQSVLRADDALAVKASF